MTLGAPFVANFLAERKMLEKNEILLTRILFGSHFFDKLFDRHLSIRRVAFQVLSPKIANGTTYRSLPPKPFCHRLCKNRRFSHPRGDANSPPQTI